MFCLFLKPTFLARLRVTNLDSSVLGLLVKIDLNGGDVLDGCPNGLSIYFLTNFDQ